MTLRQRLRHGTDDLHDELDALLGRFDLSKPGEYRAFLAIHAHVLPPFERALEQGGIADLLPDWNAHRRTPLLERDLASLGEPMPSPAAVPPLSGPGPLVGTAYVIEGSRLGSRFLAKRVGDAMPSEYLNASEQQEAWPAFLNMLDTTMMEPFEADRAIDSARAAFALFLAAARESEANG